MVRASWRPYCRILNRPCLEVHLRLLDMWLILALTTFSSGEWPAINLTYYLWKVTTEEWLAKPSSRVSRELQATRPGLRLSGQVVGSLPSSPTTKPEQGLQTDQRNQGIWGAGLSSHWPNGRRQPWGCIWGGFKTAGEEQGCLVKTCVIHKTENNSNTTGKWKITLFAEFSWVTSFHSCGYQVTESSNMQGKSTASEGVFTSCYCLQVSPWFSELSELIGTGIHCCYRRWTSKSTSSLLSTHFQGDQSDLRAI